MTLCNYLRGDGGWGYNIELNVLINNALFISLWIDVSITLIDLDVNVVEFFDIPYVLIGLCGHKPVRQKCLYKIVRLLIKKILLSFTQLSTQ